MTDLREALKRSAPVSDSMEPDHARIDKRTTQLVRRRRLAYSALSVMVVAAVGFSGLQIAQGDWFGTTDKSGSSVATSPDELAEIQIKPKNPVEGDMILVRVENIGETEVRVEPEVEISPEGNPEGDLVEIPIGGLQVLAPGTRTNFEPLSTTGFPAGTYTVTKSIREGAGEVQTIDLEFTVAEAPAPIEVTEPAEGETLISPFTVAGDASVYEGTVSIRLKDENGKVIAETFTTADCGGPCRGDYSGTVEFTVDERQNGTLEVYSVSAETGEPMDMVTIPVILSPEES